MYERQWVKCKRKRNLKNIKSSFWLTIWFVWNNILVHPLANKSWWLKGTIFCPYTWSRKLAFIYSPKLITVWKHLLVKTRVEAIMQYYENLVASFENKLNFMKYRLKYLKNFDKKLILMICDLPHTYFHLGEC